MRADLALQMAALLRTIGKHLLAETRRERGGDRERGRRQREREREREREGGKKKKTNSRTKSFVTLCPCLTPRRLVLILAAPFDKT